MMRLYNTLTRKTEPFEPMNDDGVVRMFSCGPSIYRRPHLGNYRSFAWEDILQRYLEYKGYGVQRVLNFTDVEDKAIEEAQREGTPLEELTEQVAAQFFTDAGLLRIKLPDSIPRSSTSIDQAVKLIQVLLDKGYAYWHKGDVFFEPTKFDGFGKLFRLDMNKWPKQKRRFRKDTYRGKRWNLGDFILWHGYRRGDKVFWDTEIGRGRPSWNIQDPAMVTKHLGWSIDISCGGIDNLYRHHDYNLAVIEAASGKEFARFWIHGEHLLVDGKKMSKSVGNIVYLENLLAEGFDSGQVRYYLVSKNHRKRMNLTRDALAEAAGELDRLRGTVRELLSDGAPTRSTDTPTDTARECISSLCRGFEHHMDNDLDTRAALDHLSETVRKLLKLKRSGALDGCGLEQLSRDLQRIDSVLQVLQPVQN